MAWLGHKSLKCLLVYFYLILAIFVLHGNAMLQAIPSRRMVAENSRAACSSKMTVHTMNNNHHQCPQFRGEPTTDIIDLNVSVPEKQLHPPINVDASLVFTLFFWFLGNYYYNIWNKLCLKEAGGSSAFPMTIATLQLGVGCIYACLTWCLPFVRPLPKISRYDIISMIPVSCAAMGSHSASVFAFSAGAVSFAQIVKAAEPAFAAFISVFFHGKKISLGKSFMLLPIVGGVIIASIKELDFAWSALISASIANIFAAIKGSENKKLLEKDGLKERIGGVSNQFALTTLFAFLISIPIMIYKEGNKFYEFIELLKHNEKVRNNLILSGLSFHIYNELATFIIKKTNAVTQSVANTAKRVIVIIGVALIMGESLPPIKLAGCFITILGVFFYSVIDQYFKPN